MDRFTPVVDDWDTGRLINVTAIMARDDKGDYLSREDVIDLLNKLRDSLFVDGGLDATRLGTYQLIHRELQKMT